MLPTGSIFDFTTKGLSVKFYIIILLKLTNDVRQALEYHILKLANQND